MNENRDELDEDLVDAASPQEAGITPTTEVQPEDEWLEAPKTYLPEYAEEFSKLPVSLRKFLHERETGFGELQAKADGYKWVNETFAPIADLAKADGFKNEQELFNYYGKLHQAFAKDPAATLKIVADAYGLLGPSPAENPDPYAERYNQLQAEINEMRGREAQRLCAEFFNAKDANGQPLHPYMADVKGEMMTLLKGGVATTMDDAYNKAIWLNEAIRDKVMLQKTQKELDGKIKEAAKAKTAGFSPKGKAQPPEEELTLRQELERQFAALDED